MVRTCSVLTLVAACSGPATPPAVAPPPTASIAPAAPEGAPGGPAASAEEARTPLRLHMGAPQRFDDLEIALERYQVERIEPDPDGHYPGGVGATAHLRVRGFEVVLSDLPDGYESERVAWLHSHRIELVAHGDDEAGWVDLHLDRLEPVGSPRRLEVARGALVALGDGVGLRFVEHGHKHVMAGGPESPLLVSVAYERDGAVIDEQHFSLEPPERASWRWRTFELHLVDYDYDARMVLDVATLARRPVP